jgi:phage-related protein
VNLVILDDVRVFINKLSPLDSAKILAELKFLEMNRTEVLIIKPLKGKIMELSVRQYRIIFCKTGSMIYVINGFKKQSKKTPLRVIEQAEKVYREIIRAL